jgi:hypothetical protein
VQITNVSYGEVIADADSRSVVKLTFAGFAPDDDKEVGLSDVTTVLCALTPGKVLRLLFFMEALFFIYFPGRTCYT